MIIYQDTFIIWKMYQKLLENFMCFSLSYLHLYTVSRYSYKINIREFLSLVAYSLIPNKKYIHVPYKTIYNAVDLQTNNMKMKLTVILLDLFIPFPCAYHWHQSTSNMRTWAKSYVLKNKKKSLLPFGAASKT